MNQATFFTRSKNGMMSMRPSLPKFGLVFRQSYDGLYFLMSQTNCTPVNRLLWLLEKHSAAHRLDNLYLSSFHYIYQQYLGLMYYIL